MTWQQTVNGAERKLLMATGEYEYPVMYYVETLGFCRTEVYDRLQALIYKGLMRKVRRNDGIILYSLDIGGLKWLKNMTETQKKLTTTE